MPASWLKVAMGQQTNEDVAEVIRKSFVYCIREGDRLCLDLDKGAGDWDKYKKADTFDPEEFFNY